MDTIGDRIKRKRKEKGISADKLAEILNVSRSTIFRYENGDIEKVPASILMDIASALNTTSHHLMGWDVDTDQRQPEPRKQHSANRNIEFYDKKMLDVFTQLNDDNKKKSIIYTENLLSNQKLDEELFINAAHERTDVEVTDEMRKHDDDIMNNPDEWK